MIQVYHGSYVKVSQPNLSFSRANLDFGQGFYLTPLREQAERWALRFLRRNKKAYLNIYSLDLKAVSISGFRVKSFFAYNGEWLDFVLASRRQGNTHEFDLVQGGVANDKVFNTVELYFDNLIDKDEAIKRLKFEEPNHQICILKQEIIDKYLSFVSACEVSDESQ